jgi:CDP-2,3-bis-(O-geranylgeranyl)-sn-glycerol synthase
MNDHTTNLTLLLLLGVANGTPIFLTAVLKDRLVAPLDFGMRLPDGQPVFGSSKTFRGLVGSIGATTVLATLLGLESATGAALAGLSMLGDLGSSFLKRRLGLPPHAQAFGLDQLPEVLLPLFLLKGHLHLSGTDIVLLAGSFIILEIWLSRLLFRLHIRDRPY